MTKRPIFHRDIGAGSPLVLIHGDFNDGYSAWTRQLEPLAEYHRLISVDRRGNGQSPKEPLPYTIHDDAIDIFELLESLAIDHYHLVGHSYGGIVAIEMALLEPETIRSLHLIEPPYMALLGEDEQTGGIDQQERRLTKEEMASLSDEEITEVFFRMIAGENGLRSIQASQQWPSLVREARRFVNAEHPGEYPAAAIRRLNLSVPIQIYTGGRSSASLQATARDLAARIPNATLVEIPEAFHGVQMAGEPFNQALLKVTLANDYPPDGSSAIE